LFGRKKKKDSFSKDTIEKKIESIKSACKHYELPLTSLVEIDFECSLGKLSVLPNEILQLILSYLSPIELIRTSLTSKGFWIICTDDSMWRAHYHIYPWYSQEAHQDVKDAPSRHSVNSAAQTSATKEYCCWKEHFKNRYKSKTETYGRYHSEYQKITREIEELKLRKQLELSDVGRQFQQAEFTIDSFALSVSVAVYMLCIYYLWNISKMLWDVLAFLPYAGINYWFHHCFEFKGGLVLQCWNETGSYFREASSAAEAFLDGTFQEEFCLSLVFPCSIIRQLSLLIWLGCGFFYGAGFVFGLVGAALGVKSSVRQVVTNKPFTEFFPKFDLEALKREKLRKEDEIRQKYLQINSLQTKLNKVNSKLATLRNPPSSSSSTGSGYSCIVM